MSDEMVHQDVAVTADEVTLSLLGWEVVEGRARLSSTIYTDRGKVEEDFHELALSVELRFNADDWTDRYQHEGRLLTRGDFIPSVVAEVRCPRVSPEVRHVLLTLKQFGEARGVVRVAERGYLLSGTGGRVNASDVHVRLTAFDEQSVPFRIETLERAEPLEVVAVDETTAGGGAQVRLQRSTAWIERPDGGLFIALEGTTTVTDSDALVRAAVEADECYDAEDAEDQLLGSRDRGATREGPPRPLPDYLFPYRAWLPTMRIEVLDETGFILEDRQAPEVYWEVPTPGATPGRPARWVHNHHVDASDMPGVPHKVVLRLTDHIE